MSDNRLALRRLELVPLTAELAHLEQTSPVSFGRKLRASIPVDWPPENWTGDVRDACLSLLDDVPDWLGGGGWYVLSPPNRFDRRELVGVVGCGGQPHRTGTAVLGYSILAEYRCQGYATEAVGGVVEWALARGEVQRVVAETFSFMAASVRVLEKNGFVPCGRGSEIGSIRFERRPVQLRCDSGGSEPQPGQALSRRVREDVPR